MTEATPLTDVELAEWGKLLSLPDGEDGPKAKYLEFHRRILSTIADRDRIIARAKMVAEQQAKLIAELKENLVECENTLDHHIAVSQDRPVDQVVQARKIIRASRSSARPDDHHDSLHADVMATEAEGNKYNGLCAPLVMALFHQGISLPIDIIAKVADELVVCVDTRQPRSFDPGKVRQAVHKAILGDGMYATYLRVALSNDRTLQERADSDSVLDRVSEYLCSPGADIWKCACLSA